MSDQTMTVQQGSIAQHGTGYFLAGHQAQVAGSEEGERVAFTYVQGRKVDHLRKVLYGRKHILQRSFWRQEVLSWRIDLLQDTQE
jgi:hypothetical protein